MARGEDIDAVKAAPITAKKDLVKRSQSERKAELLEKAERMIDELLAWEEGADKPMFAEIEAEVMRVRKQMDEAMISEVQPAHANKAPPGDALTREANYFHHHQRRMNYMELRENQWLIGSGAVESEAKQFKHRLTGAGMRWSRQGIENLIPIRAAVMGDRFHQNWEQAKSIPRN